MTLLQKLTDSLIDSSRTTSNKASIGNTPKIAPLPSPSSHDAPQYGQLNTKVNTQRFEQWSSIGQLQLKHSQAQGAERSLTQVYRSLINVEKTSKTNVRHPQQAAEHIRMLESKVSQNLTGALQPKLLYTQIEQKSYQLASVDLLSPKPAETINLVIPAAGKSVSFHLTAYAKPQENLARINDALAPLKIKAEIANNNVLLSLPQSQQRMLDEPVLFSGEGTRVPAGNPVPVKLTPQGSDLSELAHIIEQDKTQNIHEAIQTLKGKTKSTISQVRQFISQINVEAELSLPNMNITPVQEEIGQALQQGDFGSRLTHLLAQAHISRDTTVALLKNTK